MHYVGGALKIIITYIAKLKDIRAHLLLLHPAVICNLERSISVSRSSVYQVVQWLIGHDLVVKIVYAHTKVVYRLNLSKVENLSKEINKKLIFN